MEKNNKSSYLEYLPEIYWESDFINQFLKIFEKILTGRDDGVKLELTVNEETHEQPGISQILDIMSNYFDPRYTPAGFLDWLAGWVALELPEDWPEKVKRQLIPQIVNLYKKRGTKQGLEEFLKIYVGPGVYIEEWLSSFQIGKSSTIGENTVLGEGPPGFFTVRIIIPEANLEKKKKKEQAVRAIIDLEKPAHTYYKLGIIMPAMQIGVRSTIGVDTLLVNTKNI